MKKKLYKYKYLQVLWFDDLKFYPSFVKMINTNNFFCPEDFLFVTPYKSVYIALQKFSNVKLIKEHDILTKYVNESEWVFFHPINLKIWKIILIPKRIAHKIIWRTWGHDIRPCLWEKSKPLASIIRKLLWPLYTNKIHQFHAIGVSNDIDKINIVNIFSDNIKMVKLDYGTASDQTESLKSIKEKSILLKNKTLKIMVGHNGGKAENHLQNLMRLSSYKKEDIMIIIPLSYGIKDDEETKMLKISAYQTFGNDKIFFLEKFLPFEEYARYISNIDIAIMDQEFSNGLGNLSLLCYFEKKIYVNRKGNVAQSFLSKGIKPNYSDTIGKESFSEFGLNIFDKRCSEYAASLFYADEAKNSWLKCFEELNNSPPF